jgi:hypothetical protein
VPAERGKHISRGGIRPLARNRFSTKHIHATPMTLAAWTASFLYPGIDDGGWWSLKGREPSMRLSSRRRRLLFGRGSCLCGLCGLLRGLGLLLGSGLAGSVALGTVRRCPEREVVTEQLHDERGIAVRLLGQRVELGDGVVECLLGKVASAVG